MSDPVAAIRARIAALHAVRENYIGYLKAIAAPEPSHFRVAVTPPEQEGPHESGCNCFRCWREKNA